jgi:cellulose biosynthesis protein BcsQ
MSANITKVVSVYSPVGGSLKTTIAVNLAVGLTKQGLNVVLFDLSTQCNATGFLYQRKDNALNFEAYYDEMSEAGDQLHRGLKRKLFGGSHNDPKTHVPRRSLVEIAQSIDAINKGIISSLEEAPELGVEIIPGDETKGGTGLLRLITGNILTCLISQSISSEIQANEQYGRFIPLLDRVVEVLIKKYALDVIIFDLPREEDALIRKAIARSTHLVLPLPVGRNLVMPLKSVDRFLGQIQQEVQNCATPTKFLLEAVLPVFVLKCENDCDMCYNSSGADCIEEKNRDEALKTLTNPQGLKVLPKIVNGSLIEIGYDQDAPLWSSDGHTYFDSATYSSQLAAFVKLIGSITGKV